MVGASQQMVTKWPRMNAKDMSGSYTDKNTRYDVQAKHKVFHVFIWPSDQGWMLKTWVAHIQTEITRYDVHQFLCDQGWMLKTARVAHIQTKVNDMMFKQNLKYFIIFYVVVKHVWFSFVGS